MQTLLKPAQAIMFFLIVCLFAQHWGHAKKTSGQIKQIEKIELIPAENGIGLKISATGDLEIKKGVIAKSGDLPRRVYFDFSRAKLSPLVSRTYQVYMNGVDEIRCGQFQDDVARLVVEADKSVPVQVKVNGHQTEIWFGQAPQSLSVTVGHTDTPVGLTLRKIVIDPGHGGNDPGAIGKRGVREKDITLAISKRLKEALERQMPGVRVFLTREKDKYVSLTQRTQYANNLNADLFVSIHVNSAPDRKTRGIETYYLNISHDRYAKRLASRENAMSESEISNLEFILADLAVKSNLTDSVRLGRELQSSVSHHMQKQWSDVKDLGLKHALFSVLLGARMPAVLLETAFISNREDEKRLATSKYQAALVDGMVKGLRRFTEQKQAMYTP